MYLDLHNHKILIMMYQDKKLISIKIKQQLLEKTKPNILPMIQIVFHKIIKI